MSDILTDKRVQIVNSCHLKYHQLQKNRVKLHNKRQLVKTETSTFSVKLSNLKDDVIGRWTSEVGLEKYTQDCIQQRTFVFWLHVFSTYRTRKARLCFPAIFHKICVRASQRHSVRLRRDGCKLKQRITMREQACLSEEPLWQNKTYAFRGVVLVENNNSLRTKAWTHETTALGPFLNKKKMYLQLKRKDKIM